MKELVKLGGNQDEVAAAVVIERPDAEYIARDAFADTKTSPQEGKRSR